MTLSTDRKALLFLGAIAILGAGVRVVRWSKSTDSVADQAALERQLGAADSAAHASGRPKAKQKAARTRRTTPRSPYKDATGKAESPSATPAFPPREAPGYVLGKLDVDAATLAQIDSLPGVGPTIAKRIVTDRAEHGPFVTLQRLRRVKGVGPALLRRIDSLVTFSATLRPLNAGPESVSARPNRRVKR